MRSTIPLILVLLCLGAAAVPAGAQEENPAQRLLAEVEMGEALVGKTVILFPLRLPAAPEKLGVTASTTTGALTFAEPEKSGRKYDLLARNEGDTPVLLPGGTVLEGGFIDRLVTRPHLLGPGATVTMRTLPAAFGSDTRKEAAPFKVDPSLAPLYLRHKALFGAGPSLVPNFVAKWLEFRDEGDERRSLVAVAGSDLLQRFALQDREKAGVIPDVLKDGRLVGAVTAIRGRLQGVALWGSNDLLLAVLPPAVNGAAWANAAVVLKAEKLGVPVPGTEEPEGSLAELTKDAARLLERVRKAKYKPDEMAEGEVGEAWSVRTGISGIRGRAITHEGRLVFFAVFAQNPFEDGLYGSTVRPPADDEDPDEADEEDPGRAELSRRAGSGARLTKEEERLLRRMGGMGGPRPGRR